MSNSTNNALIPYNDVEKMGSAIAKSNLFGVKTPEQAVALMLIAQAEGLHPAIAARDYNIIQGRPALKTDAMLARFQQAGGKVQWEVYTDAEVKGTFSHPQGGTLSVSWTFAQAKAIGLTGKDNWRNYPRAMLRARCVSEGIRSVYPGCVVGVYTPEEVEDFSSPTQPAPSFTPAPTLEVLEEVRGEEVFPLFVPGSPEPHKVYNTLEEWHTGFTAMEARIKLSTKLDDDIKELKLSDLADCNKELLNAYYQQPATK